MERKAREKTLPASYYAEASRLIREKVLNLPSWKKSKTLMAYIPTDTEPDIRELIDRAVQEGKKVLLPRCVTLTKMKTVPFSGWNRMQKNAYDIQEPIGETVTDVPDLILVPCVAATKDGLRLGHGAGYYDRFLRNQPGLKVCLCFRAFLYNELPTNEGDVPMDLVLTDDE